MDRSRFKKLWNDCLLPGAPSDADAVFDELHAAYGDAARHYHSGEHIEHCLRQFDMVRERLDEPRAVELAIWFHDLVYEPCASDNERLSAERFATLGKDCMPAAMLAEVVRLIRATEHCGADAEGDTAHLLDIDLSSFGLPWDLFWEDSQRVRQEFAHLDDEQFYPAHLAFQWRLLARPRLFASDYFFDHYELRARDNICRHLDALAQRGLRPATGAVQSVGGD